MSIDNLEKKLNGELPINRLELLYLINSWGRDNDFYTNEIKKWINNNREKMNEIDLKDKYGDEIDDFFSKFTNINIEVNSIQRKEI